MITRLWYPWRTYIALFAFILIMILVYQLLVYIHFSRSVLPNSFTVLHENMAQFKVHDHKFNNKIHFGMPLSKYLTYTDHVKILDPHSTITRSCLKI